MFKYAQLNDQNVCTGVSDLSDAVNSVYMIRLSDDEDRNLISWLYNDGVWNEPESTAWEPQPTELETLNAIQFVAALQNSADIAKILEIVDPQPFARAFSTPTEFSDPTNSEVVENRVKSLKHFYNLRVLSINDIKKLVGRNIDEAMFKEITGADYIDE